MRSNKLTVPVVVWAISIILWGATRSTYPVEKAMEVFNFDFPSKEAYAIAVNVVEWIRWLYFAALAFLTVYLVQRQRSWQ